MTRRAFGLLRRLPAPIQDYVFWAIERFALFVLLMLAIPVLVVAFIVATMIFALISALWSPSGLVGTVLVYTWLGSWTILPVVITVRMWRAIPILKELRKLAIDGPGLE